MIEVTPEYLLNVVEEDILIKIWEAFQGARIYFPSKRFEFYQIKKSYEKMTGSHNEKINQLSYIYGKSKSSIILAIKKDTFLTKTSI